MSTKDYRGREIVIEVSDDPDPTKKKKDRRGFIPPPKRPGDPLTRRQDPPEQTDVALDVYDLGRTTSGDDISFRKDYTLTVVDSDVPGRQPIVTISDRNITDAFNAAILSELASGTGAGRRITNLNVAKYGSAVSNVCSGSWDEDRGFVRGAGGHIIVNNGNPFYYFRTSPSTDGGDAGTPDYTKVTESLDYNAPDVSTSFLWDRDAELFLAPRAFSNGGSSKVGFQFSGGGTTFEYYSANNFAEALPRSYFLDNPDWESFRGVPMFSTGYNMVYWGDNTVAAVFTGNPTIINSWRTMMQTRPGARLYKWTAHKFTGDLISQGAEAPGSFPTYTGPTPIPPFSTQPFYNTATLPAYAYGDLQEHNFSISPGHFLGALRLKPTDDLPEKWYYFWRKVSTVLWSLSTVAQAHGGAGSIFGTRWWVRV